MHIDWMKNGERYSGTPSTRGKILAAMAAIDSNDTGPGEWDRWLEIPREGSLIVGFMPGEGIKAMIQQLRLPKVSHIGISADLSPMGFYGVRCLYKDVLVEVFAIDDGVSMTPVCARVFNRETEANIVAERSPYAQKETVAA